MAAAAASRISASKARMHTRKAAPRSPLFSSRLWYKAALFLMAVLLSWAVSCVRPPPTKICGTPGGPPVTAPRVKLSDGRYLAYKEGGVSKEQARYKVVLTHAYSRSRHDLFPASKELIEKLGVYFVSYDRAGYGQSDPNPGRNVKSEARDIEELADAMQLGPKFYLITNSIGGYSGWGSIKYIPHRLAGVAMVVPVVNYWWPSLNTPEGRAIFDALPLGDRVYLRVAHYVPWLVYWWTMQRVFPTSSTVNPKQAKVCESDQEARQMMLKISDPSIRKEAVQQGMYESMSRDAMVAFGSWEFDPAELENPGVQVHIWQGEDDYLVPAELQRMVVAKHDWITYHGIPEKGHHLLLVPSLPDQILETLISGISS